MSSDPVGAPIRLGPESQSPLPTRTWLQVRSQKCEGRQTHSLTALQPSEKTGSVLVRAVAMANRGDTTRESSTADGWVNAIPSSPVVAVVLLRRAMAWSRYRYSRTLRSQGSQAAEVASGTADVCSSLASSVLTTWLSTPGSGTLAAQNEIGLTPCGPNIYRFIQ